MVLMVFLIWCCKTKNKVKILYGSLRPEGFFLDEIRLSSLTYFDRMQFCEKHIKGLCSMADKAYRRFYRIFTAYLVKVSF